MKDLLVFGIDFLLVLLIINLAINGMAIGGIEILSVKQIQEKSASVTTTIENSNKIQDYYYSVKEGLKAASSGVDASAQKYNEVLSKSSEEVKNEANNQTLYDIEYIWAEIGKIASNYDLSIKITVEPTGVDSINTLKFKLMGRYAGITQFMGKLEENKNFDFRIEDFDLFIYEQKTVSALGDDGVKKYLLQTIGATFAVNNVAIKQEKLTKEFTRTTYEEEAGNEYQGYVDAPAANTTGNNVATNTANGTNATTDTNSANQTQNTNKTSN